jgi:hypothetical protein
VTRRSPAIDCDTLELIFICFGLLVRQKSVDADLTMVCKIFLQKRLLVHERSTDAKTQFAILYRPLRMTCSQPLSLHDCGKHLCRDGGAKGRYFESAHRGGGADARSELRRLQLGSACSLAT